MKELKDIFAPEISPIHKVDLSIAVQFKTEATDQDTIIPAGTLLKGASLADPSVVAEVALVADVANLTGILMHDVSVPAGTVAGDRFSVAMMVEGVVYEDVMVAANESANYEATVKAALTTLGIKTYGVKTIGKSR